MCFNLVRPCAHCPFRNDIPAYLTQDRVREIEESLDQGTFSCHETTVDVEDDDGCSDRVSDENSQHCAGALILLTKMGQSSNMMRVGYRLGLYDPRALDMSSPVYTSFDEMVAAQPS